MVSPGGDDRIPVGYVKRAHGVRGAVLVVLLSDNPDRFSAGSTFLVDPGLPEPSELTVESTAPHNEGLVVRFAGVTDRSQAETLRGAQLTISIGDRRSLEEGEFWPDDLIGLQAIDPAGASLGTVTDVVLGDAQDRLVVTVPSGIQVEVPFVTALVAEPHNGRIVINPPTGLFPTDRES